MTQPPSPDSLIASLAAGHPAAYEALYQRLGRSLLRVARAILHNVTDAEDAVQDVFVNLARFRDRLGRTRDLDAYVFAVLRNVTAQRLRSRQTESRHLRIVAANAPPPPAFAIVEPDEGLRAALANLPLEQREVVALKVEGGLTFVQIAEIVGVNANTIAGRYRYAMEKLRAAMNAAESENRK